VALAHFPLHGQARAQEATSARTSTLPLPPPLGREKPTGLVSCVSVCASQVHVCCVNGTRDNGGGLYLSTREHLLGLLNLDEISTTPGQIQSSCFTVIRTTFSPAFSTVLNASSCIKLYVIICFMLVFPPSFS